MNFIFSHLLCIYEVILLSVWLEKSIFVNGYGERDYFHVRDDSNPTYVTLALQKLEHAPEYVKDWPDTSIKLGQVSGVTLDNAGRLLVFHRGENVWDEHTFSSGNVYLGIGKAAIQHKTILLFNDTGELVDMWGDNFYHIPHGITVDFEGNVWTTDVAMHQVFKFNATNRRVPAMVLGEKFVPGTDDHHYCKPSAVAIMSTGDFFVSDGYCNHRILKYNPKGEIILQWGTHNSDSPFSLSVPHALSLAEELGAVLVADREDGRVASFRLDNGSYVASYASWLMGPRIFSMAYSPVHGGRLYVVNGPNGMVPVRGYVLEMPSGRLLQTFDSSGGLVSPHDVAVSADGSTVYVAELDPHRVHKFVDERLRNESVPRKPTAVVVTETIVPVESPLDTWRWVSAGVAATLTLFVAALLLRRALRTGRKGTTRRRWEYGSGEFKLRRLLERRRFTRVQSDDSDDEPAPMLPPHHATA